jgi:hypothetical protein
LRLFAEKCACGIEENREQCKRYAELTPHIGYDRTTEIVKQAAGSGRPLREVAREAGVPDYVLDEALDYRAMANPHGPLRRPRPLFSRRSFRRPFRVWALSSQAWGTEPMREPRVRDRGRR